MGGKATLAIPVISSLVAFVLLLLALLAGSKPGMMEDFEIVRFNTSQLGKNLIPVSSGSPTQDLPSVCTHGFIGKLCSPVASAAANIESSLEEGLNKIENAIADKLADELGIHEFYSVHPLTICEGDFSPNTTAAGAIKNVTKCTKPFSEFNVSAILDHELDIGPWKLSLSDVTFGVSDDIQHAIDQLHDVTLAFAVVIIICVALAGLCFLASLPAFISNERRALLLLNIILSALAMLVVLVSAILITVGVHKAVKEVNDHGNRVGMAAAVGTKFEALVWSATILMIIVFVYWVVRLVSSRKSRRKGARG